MTTESSHLTFVWSKQYIPSYTILTTNLYYIKMRKTTKLSSTYTGYKQLTKMYTINRLSELSVYSPKQLLILVISFRYDTRVYHLVISNHVSNNKHRCISASLRICYSTLASSVEGAWMSSQAVHKSTECLHNELEMSSEISCTEDSNRKICLLDSLATPWTVHLLYFM